MSQIEKTLNPNKIKLLFAGIATFIKGFTTDEGVDIQSSELNQTPNPVIKRLEDELENNNKVKVSVRKLDDIKVKESSLQPRKSSKKEIKEQDRVIE